MTGRFLADVSPELARGLLRLLTAAVDHEARAHGALPGPALNAFLRELHAATAAVNGSTPTSENGSESAAQSIVEITTDQAAEVMGCSARRIRQLVHAGRVRARRAGHTWLVDSADLDRYRHGRRPAA